MNFEPKKERKKGSSSKNKSRKTSNQSYFSKWVSYNLRRFWEIKKNFNSWVGPDMTQKNKKNSVFTYCGKGLKNYPRYVSGLCTISHELLLMVQKSWGKFSPPGMQRTL